MRRCGEQDREKPNSTEESTRKWDKKKREERKKAQPEVSILTNPQNCL